jgi:hypothetical protein
MFVRKEDILDLDFERIADLTPIDEPFCPFCAGVMAESDDHLLLVCVACNTTALLEDRAL